MINVFIDLYDLAANYFVSSDFQKTLILIKLISAAISFFFIFIIAILLSRSQAAWWVGERIDSFRKVNLPQKTEQRWLKIKERLEKGDEANLKMAIIEADGIFDDLLKRMAFPGKDMAERLTQFEKHELKSIDELWAAHRLRNLIVHEPAIKITQQEAERAIKGYEAALKELEVL